MTRIVFMGTPEFAVPSLQALIATQNVVGVVTQPDRPAGRGRQLRPSPVKEVAIAAGIPVYQPKSLRKEETAVPLQEWQPDLIVVAAFGQILRAHVLDLPPLGCLNVHASLLPRWRGAAPIQYAIMAGDTETGVTLMKMDVGLDTGPTYVQQAIPIRPRETAASLHDRLADLGGQVLRTYLPDVISGRLPAIPQDDNAFTYAPMIQKDEGTLRWGKTAVELDRHIRAMTPWPGAYTTWKGVQLKILEAEPVLRDLPAGHPGEVVQRTSPNGQTSVLVLTVSGGLALQTVQLAGKRAIAVQDFVRGQPDFIGSKLGE
ncbi:MAG: methionyl-tRNA formyltransferase [Chloroflexota bacterium]|nr:methionyl-tRNA formyltransferase [Ardenticatenaceae bacterium]